MPELEKLSDKDFVDYLKQLKTDVTYGQTKVTRRELKETIRRLERFHEALLGNNGALIRMDQARRLLHKGPDSTWGVLDTKDIRRRLEC